MSSIVIIQLISVATACSAKKLRGSFIIMCIAVIAVVSEMMPERIEFEDIQPDLLVTSSSLNVSMVRFHV